MIIITTVLQPINRCVSQGDVSNGLDTEFDICRARFLEQDLPGCVARRSPEWYRICYRQGEITVFQVLPRLSGTSELTYVTLHGRDGEGCCCRDQPEMSGYKCDSSPEYPGMAHGTYFQPETVIPRG